MSLIQLFYHFYLIIGKFTFFLVNSPSLVKVQFNVSNYFDMHFKFVFQKIHQNLCNVQIHFQLEINKFFPPTITSDISIEYSAQIVPPSTKQKKNQRKVTLIFYECLNFKFLRCWLFGSKSLTHYHNSILEILL